ncbi:hypothetical protein ACUUL3_07975 [Thiovibrio sp. JS02]
MPPAYRSSLINLQNIDFQDTSNSLAPEGALAPSARLMESVRRAGILHPPILKEEETAMLRIVAGRRRLLAAQQTLRASSCVCLVLPAEATAAETLAVSLEDTLLRGEVSVIEQAIFFAKMLEQAGEAAACAFLPAIGLEPHPVNMRKLLRLLDLEEHLLLALHQGFLHDGVARELLNCSFTDRMSLFEVMDLLKLSVSNQKKLTAGCRELAARTGGSVMAILGQKAVREIIEQPEMNVPQKAARLMQWLGEQRYPRLYEAELDFRHFAASLRLPQGASLSHSPSFEQDRLELILPFRDREELAGVWPEMRRALMGD